MSRTFWIVPFSVARHSILKSRHITLPTKVRLVKAMVFPVVMYGCESWTLKEAEHQRIDVFELWCWRRLLKVPWIARRSNQSILKETSPGCSLEGLMLRLKLQYFGHLVQKTDSLDKTLMLRKIEGGRRRGWEDEMVGWHHQWDGHGFGWTPGVGDRQGGLPCCSPWGHKELDTKSKHDWNWYWETWKREGNLTYIRQSSKRTEEMEEKKFLQSDHDLGYD